MSFVSVLILIALVFSILEFMADRYPAMQNQLYWLSFVLVAVWCTAKYAYGPDITTYIPYYDKFQGISYDIHHLDNYKYEPGFDVFCSLMKTLGCTFWEMTAVISILYFLAIALVLQRLPRYRATALLAIVFLDSNLILSEFRQCLAVTFFIFFILSFEKKHYVLSTVWVLLCISMHKSAMLIVLGTVLFYFLQGIDMKKTGYILLALLIVGMLFIPLQPLLDTVLDKLPMMSDMRHSVEHHLQVGKMFQRVFLLYFATIFILAYYLQDKVANKKVHWLMWCCVAILVVLYPYWFLLNRLRSYFLPFLVVYIVKTLADTDIKDVLPRQLYCLFFILYVVVFVISIPSKNAAMMYPTDNISLVFERRHHSRTELENRQLKQAENYWKYDYKRLIDSGVRQ